LVGASAAAKAFDPSAPPPVFDELRAKAAAKQAHFLVLGILEELRQRGEAAAAQEAARVSALAHGDASQASTIEASIKAGDEARAKLVAAALAALEEDAAQAEAGRAQAGAVAAHALLSLAHRRGGGGVGALEAASELPRIVAQVRPLAASPPSRAQTRTHASTLLVFCVFRWTQKKNGLAMNKCVDVGGVVKRVRALWKQVSGGHVCGDFFYPRTFPFPRMHPSPPSCLLHSRASTAAWRRRKKRWSCGASCGRGSPRRA
jgi:hypothetical protein